MRGAAPPSKCGCWAHAAAHVGLLNREACRKRAEKPASPPTEAAVCSGRSSKLPGDTPPGRNLGWALVFYLTSFFFCSFASPPPHQIFGFTSGTGTANDRLLSLSKLGNDVPSEEGQSTRRDPAADAATSIGRHLRSAQTRFTPKLTVPWGLRARRTNEPPPFRRLNPLVAREL